MTACARIFVIGLLAGLLAGPASAQTMAEKVDAALSATEPAAQPAQALQPAASTQPVVAAPPPMTGDSINTADLNAYLAALSNPAPVALVPVVAAADGTKVFANPAIARLQILLDQFGVSPGVIDGFDGDNLKKAIAAAQTLAGLPETGVLSTELVAKLEARQPVIGIYTISAEDGSAITGPTPADYADKAQLAFLGYSSMVEELAERFHMDENFLRALNPNAQFAPGEAINAVITGTNRTGTVARIDADKKLRQVRAYDAAGMLLAAYPATIGSEDNPSPSGTYTVVSVTPMPNYTYNPKINFQQGENTQVLTIPPGPNGPVGSMWIALSKPTFGIHGTPEPSKIDKTGSHGCIRLTNWDADELAAMVSKGVVVTFIDG